MEPERAAVEWLRQGIPDLRKSDLECSAHRAVLRGSGGIDRAEDLTFKARDRPLCGRAALGIDRQGAAGRPTLRPVGPGSTLLTVPPVPASRALILPRTR